MAGNMKWVRYGLWEIASKGRRECMDYCRIDVSEELGRYIATKLLLELGRYVATELLLELGRYVATELLLELGHYVATERNTRSVAAYRPFSSFCPMTRVSSAKLFVRKNLFRKISPPARWERGFLVRSQCADVLGSKTVTTKLTSKSPKKKKVGNFFDKYFFEIDSSLRKPLRKRLESSDKNSRRIATYRPNAHYARSLRSDRARAGARSLGSSYVATELEPKFGRNLATELF
ncbi:hypothetical protein F2Q69_00036993 [Brassica cretica]|uniref:Uncharacterized protein n=1 Tax=Brassica cretica TaxID=69181 RepID=A0A8S9SBH1_BRACR|nr:hypothetical protein F2Q69_00036993 [Brassica cretica]